MRTWRGFRSTIERRNLHGFLKWFDSEVKKKEQNRQVLLFMDIAGVHNSAVANIQLNHKLYSSLKTQRAVLNYSMKG